MNIMYRRGGTRVPLEPPSRNRPFKEAVEKGIALLDDVRPGWREGIDLDTLDVGSSTNCILGQLYGEYSHGAERIFQERGITTRGCGFVAPAHIDGGYVALTEEWKLVLSA